MLCLFYFMVSFITKRNFCGYNIDLIDYNMYLAATFGNIKTNYIY